MLAPCDDCQHGDFHHPASGCTYWDPDTGDFCHCETFVVSCKTCRHPHTSHRPVPGDEEGATSCMVPTGVSGDVQSQNPIEVVFCDCREFVT